MFNEEPKEGVKTILEECAEDRVWEGERGEGGGEEGTCGRCSIMRDWDQSLANQEEGTSSGDGRRQAKKSDVRSHMLGGTIRRI